MKRQRISLYKLFLEIWNERPHVSEISGRPLLYPQHPQWHWQFAHILGKGAYPAFKFKKENIMLMLPEEHEKQESFVTYREKHEELKKLYYEQSNSHREG